ncbi:MAG: MOSC domain-containing protein [Myxococcota bacterium]
MSIVSASASAEAPAVVVAIHIAPGSRLPMKAVARVEVETGRGIVGDRYHGTRHRHVTVQSLDELKQAEEQHGGPIDPGLTRRNVTLSAGEIPRKPNHRWRVGEVLLEVVRDAAPCKLLEDTLGRDVKRALHRKAGVVCRVIEGGTLSLGAIVDPGPLSQSEEGEESGE